MVRVKRLIRIDNTVTHVYMRSNQRFVNSAGILEFNTWRYYINNKGCFSFKGKGIEDNYYLLRPIYLLDGTQVKSRKLFWQANAEAELIWGTDYIIGSHQAAVSLAKGIYHPNLIETADREIISDTIRHGAL